MTFTHQGQTFPGRLHGIEWPAARVDVAATIARQRPGAVDPTWIANLIAYAASGAGPETIRADLGKAVDWARSHAVPQDRLFLGEFGVSRTWQGTLAAPDDARTAWLSTVRGEAERAGMGWAYWSYEGPKGMGIRNGPEGPDPATLKALLGHA